MLVDGGLAVEQAHCWSVWVIKPTTCSKKTKLIYKL